MNRLTAVDEEELTDCAICPDEDCYLCANILNAIERLQYYENLESELEKAYGECDGLLETAVKSVLKHGEELISGKPVKARLLTDEDVDKWLHWKELSEKGQLLELPCKEDDTVYTIGWRKWCELEEEYIEEVSFMCGDCVCRAKIEYFIKPINASLPCIAGIIASRNHPVENFHVYLTKEEAEKVLEEIKNDRK